jgi:hypothetical protein
MATTQISLADLDIHKVGNEIDLWGMIYSGRDGMYIIPLPGEDATEIERRDPQVLVMDTAELERFFQQTDYLNVVGPNKVIIRKSQRVVDQTISWQVYKRDGYVCRYCGMEKPLTVDHLDLWEDGGATVAENLVAACRRCNKLRGRTPYQEWIESEDYKVVSERLGSDVKRANLALVETLPALQALRYRKVRSR